MGGLESVALLSAGVATDPNQHGEVSTRIKNQAFEATASAVGDRGRQTADQRGAVQLRVKIASSMLQARSENS